MQSYQKLKTAFKRHSELQYLQRILMWDEAVMMPIGGGQGRGKALASLNRTIQANIIRKKTKRLLDEAKQENFSAWDQANLNWMEKIYLRAEVIPLSLTEKLTKTSIASEQAWRQFRASNRWQDYLPYLQKSFECVKEIAKRRGEKFGLSPYDAMLDEYAPGFNQANIDPIFSLLKEKLKSLINKIMDKQKTRRLIPPLGPFPIDGQKQLGLEVMKALGFNFDLGRLDVSHHPFCSGGPRDVRITTRYTTQEFIQSLAGICHETGHALYEQGLPDKWLDQPVGHVQSMAMHESQSLLIEKQVCCSYEFCEYVAPLVNKQFGNQPAFSAENIYHLVTRVTPGYIRVDADEVTYPLHIILRYEIEKKLFNDELSLEDLPAIWDELMMKYLGLSTKNNDRDGVMQDVHWPSGAFGYFPAYTLGRLIAAQLFSAFDFIHSGYRNDFKEGNFIILKNWLEQHVYSQASFISANELLFDLTKRKLDPIYFINHLEERYLQ